MTSGLGSRARWMAVAVVLGALVVPGAGEVRVVQAGAAQAPNVTVDPMYFEGVSMRNLTVFSRGGRVTAVAGVPSNQQLYYMGSTGGGVWRTTDAGATWTNISDGFFEAGSIGAIAVAESNPNVIYVGTGSACPRGNVSPGDGMYKSTDAGKTWQHVGLPNAGSIGAHRRPSDKPGPRLRRGARQPVRPEQGTRRLPVARRRHDLGTGPCRQRPHRRRRPLDGREEPGHHLSRRCGRSSASPGRSTRAARKAACSRPSNGGNTWQKLGGGLPSTVMVGKIGVSVSRANPQRVYAHRRSRRQSGRRLSVG